MLNISNNSISGNIKNESFKSLSLVESRKSGKVLIRLLWGGLFFFLGFVFLPWTQNIRSQGAVTTLKPNQRPQTIQSVIGGRIEKWFVQEGDRVNQGDTILFISEIKDEYFDPNLLDRTQEQLQSKELAVNSYMEKVRSLDFQIDALQRTSDLKFKQTKNKLKQSYLKVTSDSIDFEAAKIDAKIANDQLARAQDLFDEGGLISLTKLEERRNKVQAAQAKMISAENKLLTSQNEVINAQVELSSIRAQYQKDIAKAESEKFTAMSSMYDAEAVVTKLQNQFMNYSIRLDMYYITAPQDGFITKALQSGIGETIKEGSPIVTIMPSDYQLAVEMYVKPLDLPLLERDQEVRIQFDGWPAIVFSGWPSTSYGTYGGKIFAIDNFISDNGKYRVLVAPDPNDHEWPEALRVGAGTTNLSMLKDVPIWYELWRQINGFPADFYKASQDETKKADKK